jgi:hypothetical protein
MNNQQEFQPQHAYPLRVTRRDATAYHSGLSGKVISEARMRRPAGGPSIGKSTSHEVRPRSSRRFGLPQPVDGGSSGRVQQSGALRLAARQQFPGSFDMKFVLTACSG